MHLANLLPHVQTLDMRLILWLVITIGVAGAISFAFTPLVNKLAFKIGAVDVPKDERRVHNHAIARLGGLAMYIAFIAAVLIFDDLTKQTAAILLGSVVIVAEGILDDVFVIKPITKILFQVAAAVVVVVGDVRIITLSSLNIFADVPYVYLGIFEIPITILWIVGIINAVNLIDGLDGLAVGVSTIASLSMLLIVVMLGQNDVSVMIAALVGACLGFMPYNTNPAKIFMGETGAAFLGYILATVSIQGMFKMYAVVSFFVPFLILGLPIFDIMFSTIRRLMKGQAPWKADREHIHHRLIDMGLNQKQAVTVLYLTSAILGIAAVLATNIDKARTLLVIACAVIVALFAAVVYIKNISPKK
ncbi:MAG: undecaprenyl/decaprenyl-phosphate alpha-N-acetylglucosaminyl 1-phosphate transferase [Ruminococcaceae bacterium]|nr:undecaprenyl/decaprenyl-phosphate alpha-N-acetylglucosaminyl 1-phosphate transferase [Oscillospiraceae bacterium]